MAFILAIDQGTTATKSLIIDEKGKLLSVSSTLYPQHYPKPGFVEHNALEIKESVRISVIEALRLAGIKASELAGIGITNQRETITFFDKNNHTDLPFIVWQCRRSQEICERIKNQGLAEHLHKLTGLIIDPYFSASKLLWFFENDPTLRKKAESGELLAGTIDTFLCHWFSSGALHITDVTNASRTMLMNIKTCEWSEECLDIFNIPRRCLPTIHKSIGPYGVTKGLDFLPDGIPLLAIAGDQHAALFGQACFSENDAKATFGTGCFILQNTGTKPIFSKHGLLTSVAYQIGPKPVYCLEGSAFIAGAALTFLLDAFALAKTPQEIEALAKTVDTSNGVVFVPALCGLGAPYWQPEARGAFFGLSRGTTKAHIARAVLEGIALQNTDIIDAMAKDSVHLTNLKVDGGASSSNLLMQIQADLLGVRCSRLESPHQTTLGIAYMAALAASFFSSLEDIRKLDRATTIFEPHADHKWASETINLYRNALAKL